MLPPRTRRPEAEESYRLASTILTRDPAAGGTTRILIVDQDRQSGTVLSFMLAARRFEEVRAVRSAGRAVAIMGRFLPTIVFLDLELPDDGANVVARQLACHQLMPRPRLIGLTRSADSALAAAARAGDFERWLVKPISQEALDDIPGIRQPNS